MPDCYSKKPSTVTDHQMWSEIVVPLEDKYNKGKNETTMRGKRLNSSDLQSEPLRIKKVKPVEKWQNINTNIS